MTEKRFTKCVECPNNCISFIYDNKDVLTTVEVVDLLNALHEENQQLRQILKFFEKDNAKDILNALNSQKNRIWELKRENDMLRTTISRNEAYIDRLENKGE